MSGTALTILLVAIVTANKCCGGALAAELSGSAEVCEQAAEGQQEVSGAVLLATGYKIQTKVGKTTEHEGASSVLLLGTSRSKRVSIVKPDTEGGEEKELPGSKDPSGPNAYGKSSTTRPVLKWCLVLVVLAVSGLPVALTLYFLAFPGDKDDSSEVQQEHGGSVPYAVQRAASVVFRYGWVMFRVAMFVVYMWFGILKVFGISPAEPLVQIVYREISFLHFIDPDFMCRWLVGGGECMIALGYILTLVPYPVVRFWATVVSLCIGLGHVTCVTLLPCVLLPDEVWQEGRFPYALTFEGQYIMKNLVLVAGVLLMANDLKKPEERKLFAGIHIDQ